MRKLISMRDLCKSYQRGTLVLPILSELNLDIERGEFVAIVGKSGSGKSTLLNVIGMLDNYGRGEYRLDGILIKDLSQAQVNRYRSDYIGFVFQSFNLLPFKTALENIALPLFYRQVPRAPRAVRALHLLSRVGLEDRAEHLPSELSGGEQQRVAIARALANDPPLILADEPTGNLDAATAKHVMGLFHEIHREGKTLVMVTHDESIAAAAQRVVHLSSGA